MPLKAAHIVKSLATMFALENSLVSMLISTVLSQIIHTIESFAALIANVITILMVNRQFVPFQFIGILEISIAQFARVPIGQKSVHFSSMFPHVASYHKCSPAIFTNVLAR